LEVYPLVCEDYFGDLLKLSFQRNAIIFAKLIYTEELPGGSFTLEK
jgi:hypothetical protein